MLHQGRKVARVEWALTGMHNQLNALAAMAAAHDVGVEPAVAAAALGQFQNVKRRMELRGTVRGIAVYDDFAHHPTALCAPRSTACAAALGAKARILAVFEPRSNTMKLGAMKASCPGRWNPPTWCFATPLSLDWDAADALAPLGVGPGQRAQTAPDIATLVDQITLGPLSPGDHVVCMSSGGFGGIHTRLLETLANQPL